MDSVVTDTAELATHIEATALLVAASRAVEARKTAPLVKDGFAEQFVVTAAGGWAEVFREPGPIPDLLGAGEFGRNFVNYQGARTVLFDNFITEALQGGIGQVAILAAGFDSRGFRLDWPHDATLYELDRPRVLEFKSAVLDRIDARPATKRVALGVDLEQDWPATLCEAGFDPDRPTAWLVEGLLMYLSPAAEFELLAKLVNLSAPRSRIAIEHTDAADLIPENPAGSPQQAQMRDLIRNEDRPDPVDWFADRGWRTEAVTSTDLLTNLGRPITLDFHSPLQTGRFVQASLPPE